jgi:hypothetical protein
MLYIFAGFPHNGLHAGGLQHAIETVEELAMLEHDSTIQYLKEGVFIEGKNSEYLYPVDYRMSNNCLLDGITWDWFSENWAFGNGVTCHKTLASPEFKTVVHGTNLTLDEFLVESGSTKLAELELERMHVRHEGWEEYEARWLPGTCPQENHVVHLTWLITTHKLPEFVYERIQDLIEYGAEPKELDKYNTEAGHHFSTVRAYDGQPAFHRG